MRPLIVLNGCATVQLGRGYVALIDAEDADRVAGYRWYAAKRKRDEKVYANANIRAGVILGMHRLLADVPEGMQADHRNRDTLDNRRSNLRVCTRSQNRMNEGSRGGKSRYKGVSQTKSRKRWRAAIRMNRKTTNLGSFATQEEAARAYDRAARERFGEFALTNADLFGPY